MAIPVNFWKYTISTYFLLRVTLCSTGTAQLSVFANTLSSVNQSVELANLSDFDKNQITNNFNQEKSKLGNESESNPARDLIKVETILREIFETEFEDEPGQNDGRESDDLENFALKNVTILEIPSTENLTALREGRAEFYKNRRGQRRNAQHRKTTNNRQRQVAQAGSKKPQGAGHSNRNRQKTKIGAGGNSGKVKRRIDLTKYNAYMDAVLGRMNALIRKKRMDPLRVNLYAGAGPGQKKGQGQNKLKNSGKTKKKGGARWDEEESGSQMDSEGNDDDSGNLDDSGEDEGRSVRDYTVIKPGVFQRRMRAMENVSDDTATKVDDVETEGRGKTKGDATRNTATTNDKKPSRNQLQSKKRRNGPRPTRGVLHGLSSLRREGNVQVVKDGERARIIRSRFLLGPVALEILPKKIKRKSSQEEDSSDNRPTPVPPAATATAPQLKGILEIRLSPGKPTRIRKLRVFPPGNIQVDGDTRSGSPGVKRAGYRKVTPMATARLRQTAIQVLRQVDNKMKVTSANSREQDDISLKL